MATRKKEPVETAKVEETKVEKASKPEKQVKEQPATLSGYVHIDAFLDTAGVIFNLHPYQQAGFKAFMSGRHYQKRDTDFIPYLEEYLGKEVK